MYNPDNSNEPCSVNTNIITSLPNSKQQFFNADSNNIPFENDRYPDLSIVLTEKFRPNIDMCHLLMVTPTSYELQLTLKLV